jgi:hypothetical protein
VLSVGRPTGVGVGSGAQTAMPGPGNGFGRVAAHAINIRSGPRPA